MIRFRVALSQDNIPLKCFFAIFKVVSKEKWGKKILGDQDRENMDKRGGDSITTWTKFS